MQKLKAFFSFFKFASLSPYERNVRLICLYYLFTKMFFSLPIEAVFFAQITGNFTKAMSIYALAYATGTICSLPLGVLADSWGRKKVCITGAACRVMAAIIYAFAPSYELLIIGSLFFGVYRGIGNANNDAIVYESMEKLGRKAEYHTILSRVKIYPSVGLGVGSLLSGIFIYFSMKTAMIATIFPMGIAFLISLFLTETNQRHSFTNPFKHFFSALCYLYREKRLSLYMLADSAHFAVNEATFTFGSNFYKEIIPVWSLGIFRFAGHTTDAVCSWLSGKVGKRIGLKKTIFFGACADNIFCITSALFTNFFAPFFKTLGSGANGIYTPASCTYMQNIVSEKERGTLLSVFSMCICVFYTLGTMFVGYVADLTNPATALIIGYSTSLLCDMLYIPAFRADKNSLK